jgi:tRNA/tmRNA/rRNA uracil-C5-methylase (TrmA/RlmC/RlmD family)
MKTLQVQELFKQLRGLLPRGFPPLVLDIIRMDKVFRYRSKITPHYNVPAPNKAPIRAWSRGNAATTSSTACKNGPNGFKEKASCQLVDVPYCHIATPAINNALCQACKEKQEEARQGVAEEAWQGRDAPAQ